MYIFEEMIDMGLKEGQVFPTELHRRVAQILALNNPNVKDRDTLIDVVQNILIVPIDRIQNITLFELENEFNFPQNIIDKEHKSS
jgi:RNAse (barnase) inhibitor barstar